MSEIPLLLHKMLKLINYEDKKMVRILSIDKENKFLTAFFQN